jgi:hypothetical protein
VTQRDGVESLAGGEAALWREKRGDNTSWADVNLNRLKNKKNHTTGSIAINGR